MSNVDKVLEYLKDYPWSSTTEIGIATGLDTGKVSNIMWANERKISGPTVRRKVVDNKILWACITVGEEHPYKGPVEYSADPLLCSTNNTLLWSVEEKKYVEQVTEVKSSIDSMIEEIGEIGEMFAAQIAQSIKEHLIISLRQIIPTVEELTPINIAELKINGTRVKKPTVLIAGLLASQAGVIHREFDDVFDLRFFTLDNSLKHLESMVHYVDHVFTFTSKINHAVENVIKTTGKKINRCSGGMTMLKTMLTQLYVGEVK